MSESKSLSGLNYVQRVQQKISYAELKAVSGSEHFVCSESLPMLAQPLCMLIYSYAAGGQCFAVAGYRYLVLRCDLVLINPLRVRSIGVSNAAEAYDGFADVWLTLPELKRSRYNFGIALWSGLPVVIGGAASIFISSPFVRRSLIRACSPGYHSGRGSGITAEMPDCEYFDGSSWVSPCSHSLPRSLSLCRVAECWRGPAG